MAMVERIEHLGQLEDMLGEISWLGCSDALVNDIRRLRRGEPELPEFVGISTRRRSSVVGRRRGTVVSLLYPQKSRQIFWREICGDIFTEGLHVESALAEDVRCAHDRVLRIGPSLPLETQRVFEVEGNHRRLGV